jgi:RimJ/RimL family protein N-acetyltransferase
VLEPSVTAAQSNEVKIMAVQLCDVSSDDLQLIERWLHADHVRRYWGEPEENLQVIRQPAAEEHRALIEADGRKVGLILWQHPSRQALDHAGLPDIPTTTVGIDIMIGESEAAAKDVGPAAIRLVAAETLTNEHVSYLIATTMKEDVASLRAFANAGFYVDREFNDPVSGPCVLLLGCRR